MATSRWSSAPGLHPTAISIAAPGSRAPNRSSGAVQPSGFGGRSERPLEGFSIDYAAHGCVIAHLRNMTFSAWNAAPSVSQVEAFIALAKELSSTYKQSSNVTLVLRDTELPGPEARAALELLTAQYAHAIHSVAMVIDGAGFWASMIRSFLTGLHLLRGNGYRCKAFPTVAEANPWLLPAHNADTGISVTESEMRQAHHAVLARMQSESRPKA